MRTRFFYAEHTYNTWSKIFVLTDDGVLYSEYLDFMNPSTIRKLVNFNSFNASDYSYDGYQTIKRDRQRDSS